MDFIYTPFLKLFGWNSFLNEQPNDLRGIAAQFQQYFATLGCGSAFGTLLVITIVGVILYYFKWCNGSSKRFQYRFRLKWWLIWLFSTALITALFTYIVLLIAEYFLLNNNQLGKEFYYAVSICNFIYSLVIFFVFSIAAAKLGDKHTNASCTPF